MNEQVRMNLPSRVIQIQAASQPGDYNCGPHVQIYALCEDGSVWVRYDSSGHSNVPTHGGWELVEAARDTNMLATEMDNMRADLVYHRKQQVARLKREEIERLRAALRQAAEMSDYETDRTVIYNHCMQAAESEVSDE